MKRQYVLELDGSVYYQDKIRSCLMVENAHKFDSVAEAKATQTFILNMGLASVVRIHVYVPATPATAELYDARQDVIERLTVMLDYYPQSTDNYQTISDAILYLEGSYQ